MSIFDEIDLWGQTEGKRLFAPLLNVQRPVILDYSCGMGSYTFALAHAFGPDCTVYAVDTNRRALDYIKGKAEAGSVRCVSAVAGREDFRQEFDDGTFDLILYSDLFHGEEKIYGGLHRFVMLEEAQRTLKRGGILAVLPFHLSNFRDKAGKKCRYTYRKLTDEICGYGFEHMNIEAWGVHFEKAYSPYYQQKGGLSLDELERGRLLVFRKPQAARGGTGRG